MIYARYLVNLGELLHLFYKLFVLIKKTGSKKLEKLLTKKNKTFFDFIPESFYAEKICSMRGINAIPRKNTDDFYVMFKGERHVNQILQFLEFNDNEVFVDVGANVGFYSLRVAHDYKNKQVKVICIEAHPNTYKALCRNIECNNQLKNNIFKVINKAASDKKGFVIMYDQYEKKNNRQHSRYSSIHERMIQTPSFEVQGHFSDFQIESDTLDNILAGVNVHIMKIDIEGAEIQALRGATRTLGQLRKVVVEVHGNNMETVKGMLEESHFKIKALKEGSPKHLLATKR